MKKVLAIVAITAVVFTVSVGSYAQGRGRGMYGAQDGMMANQQTQQAPVYGPRGGMMSARQNQQNPADGTQWGAMQGRRGNMQSNWNGRGNVQGRSGKGGRWNAVPQGYFCGGYGPRNMTRPGWQNAPGQTQTAPEIITEEKAKEVAGTFVTTYFPGYTVEKVEKDNWRPMYFVTLKGENDAQLQLTVHGFGGQVMHVFPVAPAEVEAE